MRIYKLEETRSETMGFPSLEKYFLTEEGATKAFEKLLAEYKESDRVYDDIDEPITFKDSDDLRKNFVKGAMIAVWDSWETDCGTEHDHGFIELEIRTIEVEEAAE